MAKKRSNYDTAPKENEAAILALAIYAGHHWFAKFVGDVQPKKGEVTLPKAKPTLKFRADLSQHFIFSAAIKILSEQDLSLAIGEFKELMDRGDDGSGYSFGRRFCWRGVCYYCYQPVQRQFISDYTCWYYQRKRLFP